MNIWDDDDMSNFVTLRHYDAEVEAVWTIDQDAEDSLQIVYDRPGHAGHPDQSFWLYLSPHSAKIIGKLLQQWGEARS